MNALGWSFARPHAAWALLLPLALLLLAQLRARPPEVVTGTLAFWDDALRDAPAVRRAPARPPAWLVAAALALASGALAWLGPRPGAAGAREWSCVVDRSPSTGLSLGATTRGAAAAELARAWLAAHADPADRVRWSADGRAALVLAPDAAPDAAWLAPEPLGTEPRWAEHDFPGTLWVTDRVPDVARAHAGVCASGGPAVEGAIAGDGRETVLWRDGVLATVPSERAPRVALVAPADARVAEPLERVFAAWAGARGYVVVPEARDDAELVVTVEPGPAEPLELARDGWRARGRGHALAPGDETEDWLVARAADGGSPVVVRAGPGRVRVGLAEIDEPDGDPAAFALSWARLLDRWTLPPEGVVALAERMAAGAERVEGGAAPIASGVDEARGARIDATLALGCALGAIVALAMLWARRG